MKNRLAHLLRKSNFLWLLAIVLSCSCTKKEEGCIDIEATNFTVTAEKNCCCNYPKLYLQYTHRYATEPVQLGNTIVGVDVSSIYNPELFYLQDLSFYCSDFRLTDENGQEHRVTDTIALPLLSGETSEQLVDDFVLVKWSNPGDTIGLFPNSGRYEKMSFKVGLTPPSANANADSIPETHPLAFTSDSLWNPSAGYIFNRFVFSRNQDVNDTLDIYGQDAIVDINLDSTFTFVQGYDRIIPLQIDYFEWFKGVDFIEDDKTVMISKIIANTNKAFSIPE